MPNTEGADNTIEKLITDLAWELGQTGFLSTPTSERKAEIIEQIAKLRASMEPTIINNNYGPQS